MTVQIPQPEPMTAEDILDIAAFIRREAERERFAGSVTVSRAMIVTAAALERKVKPTGGAAA